MLRQWRLLTAPPKSGAYNMAVDAAVAAAVGAGAVPPTLRLYAWDPPCLSLGYAQSIADVDMARLRQQGWEVVRRPTGGRAILHTDELTYSVAVPADHPLAEGSVVDSYRRISTALLAALEALGAQPHADPQSKDAVRDKSPVCFETPSHYEITVDGRKLVGSAQARRGNSVLQHGTLPLYGDVARICDALNFPNEAERESAKQLVRARAATLHDVLGIVVDWQTAADGIINAFGLMFEIDFARGELTTYEHGLVLEQLQATYSNEEWTQRL